jgi:hypothetical protein
MVFWIFEALTTTADVALYRLHVVDLWTKQVETAELLMVGFLDGYKKHKQTAEMSVEVYWPTMSVRFL